MKLLLIMILLSMCAYAAPLPKPLKNVAVTDSFTDSFSADVRWNFDILEYFRRQFYSGNYLSIKEKTADYSVLTDDDIILASGNITITLPTASTSLRGKMYQIKNISTGMVTVEGYASETIDDDPNIELLQDEVIRVGCDSDEFWIL